MRTPVNASPVPSRMPAHELGVDVGRYSFTVVDSHHLLLAGLPAHSNKRMGTEKVKKEEVVQRSQLDNKSPIQVPPTGVQSLL